MIEFFRALPRGGFALLSALLLLLVAAVPTATAGGDHDHGPAPAAASTPASPRLTAVSESYELVGILAGNRLTLYLDRRADTAPVTAARIELSIGSASGVAEPLADGTYAFASPQLAEKGEHEVIATITEADRSDLLVAALKIPAADAHAAFDHDHALHHRPGADHTHFTLPGVVRTALDGVGVPAATVERKLHHAPVLAGLGLALGLLVGGIVRGRSGIIAGIVALLTVLGAGVALAGPGHDHGDGRHDSGGGGAVGGDTPRRLPDGALLLPKPTQRLLDIRTRVLQPETARRAVRLIGRIIPDPNRSGLVQSTIGGRIKPPAGGLPVLGQSVKAGDILAYVEPAFAPIDASDVRQTAGDLEQRIALLEVRISRQQRLVDKEVASRANLQDLEIELAGLQARRAQLQRSRSEPEQLLAPVDGVIASVRIAAGQVVTSADTLLDIVDPRSLWIEAISFDAIDVDAQSTARAATGDGQLYDLGFVGRSRALQQQATVLQFRVTKPDERLSIGSPVKVLIETGAPISGLIVPRSAVAQAPNGETIAFKRLAPERYQPLPIRFDDIDGERVHVTGGLAAGDQIIVRNAPLVNQIR
jgi:RND family efflux transporter MFP subunit